MHEAELARRSSMTCESHTKFCAKLHIFRYTVRYCTVRGSGSGFYYCVPGLSSTRSTVGIPIYKVLCIQTLVYFRRSRADQVKRKHVEHTTVHACFFLTAPHVVCAFTEHSRTALSYRVATNLPARLAAMKRSNEIAGDKYFTYSFSPLLFSSSTL